MSGGSAPSMLEAIHEVYSGIPLTVSLPFHCIFVASLFEQLRNRWLLSFWVRYVSLTSIRTLHIAAC